MSISCGYGEGDYHPRQRSPDIQNAGSAPAVKRGGTVNIVTHTHRLASSVDNISQLFEAALSAP